MSARLYPPDFCDEDTMAYLLGLAPSTFRQYVAAGLLPAPLKIGNKHRWHRASVIERLADTPARASNAPPDIMEAAYGKTKGARRNAA
jgi:predicted DNA-binding transcriptional regulator AlpA